MKTCRERCHLVYVILVLAVLLAPTAEAHAQFIHQIPLKLPKGANGMQPQLALAYDPNSGNGMVGAGWQLTGLSSITRVNYGNGINYGGNDTYPHSGLGILVKQGDGSYRNKRESFTKFVPSGVCGDGPCSWVAYDRSGTQYWYGTTADSQLTILPFPLPLISPPVREWALTKVVDVFGNSYEVTYTDDLANGRIYPSVITYTKGPGLSTYRTVEFEYEGRSDMEPGYQQSVFTQMAWRLKWISVKSNGALVRKYRLDYGEYDASSGRSHLTAVQEYGSDGVSTLPAQTFGWLQGGQTLAWQRWATQQGGWGTTPFLASDFNGDGLADVAFVFPDQGDISIDLHESTGDSFDWQRWATQQGGWQGSAPFFVGDFNGDGKADIAYVFEDVGGTISMDVHEPALFAERRISPRGGMSTPPAPFGKAPGSAAERGQVSRALSGHMQSA